MANAYAIITEANRRLDMGAITLGEWESEIAEWKDAEPVRHGRWDTEVITDRLGMKHCYYACSVCGRLQDDGTPFCALCGAKMDEVEDEQT